MYCRSEARGFALRDAGWTDGSLDFGGDVVTQPNRAQVRSERDDWLGTLRKREQIVRLIAISFGLQVLVPEHADCNDHFHDIPRGTLNEEVPFA